MRMYAMRRELVIAVDEKNGLMNSHKIGGTL